MLLEEQKRLILTYLAENGNWVSKPELIQYMDSTLNRDSEVQQPIQVYEAYQEGLIKAYTTGVAKYYYLTLKGVIVYKRLI